jgi:hypothetical protein
MFLDDVSSFSLYLQVLYYQGLAQVGLKSATAANDFKPFLAIKSQGEADPMIPTRGVMWKALASSDHTIEIFRVWLRGVTLKFVTDPRVELSGSSVDSSW